MLKKILSMFTPKPTPDNDFDDIPRYPPFVTGFPVAHSKRVLGSQSELIYSIKNSIGLTNDDYERLVHPVVQRFAEFVHLLPASESHHHRGAGGLFRHGLEVGFETLKATEGFTPYANPVNTEAPKLKKQKHVIWRLGNFYAGLLHDIGKPLSDLRVTDRNGVIQWEPDIESLYDWGQRNDIDRYFIHWNHNRYEMHEAFNLLMVDKILGPEVNRYMKTVGPHLYHEMLKAIGNCENGSDIAQRVLQSDTRSVELDLAFNEYDPSTQGAAIPVEAYIMDAMRKLVSDNVWKINQKGARVWYIQDSLFIVWKQAVEDIHAHLKKHRIPGVPRSYMTLAEILIGRGYAIPFSTEEGTSELWKVSPDILTRADNKRIELQMLRLKKPTSLLDIDALPESAAGMITSGSSVRRTDEDSKTLPETALNPASEDSTNALLNDTTQTSKRILDDVISGFDDLAAPPKTTQEAGYLAEVPIDTSAYQNQPDSQSTDEDFDIAAMKEEAKSEEGFSGNDIFVSQTPEAFWEAAPEAGNSSSIPEKQKHVKPQINLDSPLDIEEMLKEIPDDKVRKLISLMAKHKVKPLENHGSLYIPYPKALELLGDAKEVYNQLRDQNVIDHVSGKPFVFIHEVGKEKGVLLTLRLNLKAKPVLDAILEDKLCEPDSNDFQTQPFDEHPTPLSTEDFEAFAVQSDPLPNPFHESSLINQKSIAVKATIPTPKHAANKAEEEPEVESTTKESLKSSSPNKQENINGSNSEIPPANSHNKLTSGADEEAVHRSVLSTQEITALIQKTIQQLLDGKEPAPDGSRKVVLSKTDWINAVAENGLSPTQSRKGILAISAKNALTPGRLKITTNEANETVIEEVKNNGF